MIDRPPYVVPFAVDLHEDLVEVPTPAAGFHPFDPSFSDLLGEHRTKAVPLISDRFVADIDTPFMQKILDIPERQREADVQHHRQADDLWARLEPLEGVGVGHAETLASTLPRLKVSLSDKAGQSEGGGGAWTLLTNTLSEQIKNHANS